jgi:hypothetical protein
MPVVEFSQFGNEVVFLNCDNPFEKSSAAPQSQALVKVGEPLTWTKPKASRPILEMMTVAGENGSELTIDENNRIRLFRDAIGRQFDFCYDGSTGELNGFTENALARWVREADGTGRYGDTWLNQSTQTRWKGTICIDQAGLSMANGSSCTLYSPCGTKTVEQFSASKVSFREKQDALGNVSFEDTAAKTISYRFADGRTALRNLSDGSLLGYDRQGNLTVMQDASDKKFEFGDYACNGKPQSVLNERGRWDMIGDQIWRNAESGRFWYGTVDIDPRGTYTYIDTAGKVSARFSNGSCVETYGGIRTTTDGQGRRSRQYLDGQEFREPALVASPRFIIKNGVTVECKLRLDAGQFSGAQVEDEQYASISLRAHRPVTAFQDGIVVFSTRCPEDQDQRKHAVIGLSEQDLSSILKFQNIGLGADMVILQCYDLEHRALRYQLYAGLGQANVVVGDRVKNGQPIGRLAEDGTLNFAVRRNSISGAGVAVLANV